MEHKVLLVDDDENLLQALRRALRKNPFEILCATSGEGALRLLRREPVDLVISDHDMVGMSGTVFLTTVRSLYPDVVRFVLTGKATLDVALESINDGAVSRFFTKPCNHVELALAIRQALQHKELLAAAHSLLKRVREQSALIDDLERSQPGITEVRRDEQGRVILDPPKDCDSLVEEIKRAL